MPGAQNSPITGGQASRKKVLGYTYREQWLLGTTILEQDLFYSSYTLSVFSKIDKLLTPDDEMQPLAMSEKASPASPGQPGDSQAA